MPNRALSWPGFLGLVSAVSDSGGSIPPEFATLTARFGELHALAVADGRFWQRRLADAILHGDSGDLAGLWTAALSERIAAAFEQQADLLGEIRDEVLAAMRDLYTPVGRINYNRLRDQFNTAAIAFTDCPDHVDPAAPADQVIGSTNPKLLAAWRDAETFAEQLDRLLEPLCCASELTRGLDQPSGLGGDRSPYLISLICDTRDLHRRVVWAAWHDSAESKPVGPLTLESLAPEPPHRATRCGRWCRLWAAGAQIAAIDDPCELTPYRGPQPYGSRVANINQRGKLQRFDPEGELPDPQAAPRRRRLARLRNLTRRRTEPETPTESTILDTFASADQPNPPDHQEQR